MDEQTNIPEQNPEQKFQNAEDLSLKEKRQLKHLQKVERKQSEIREARHRAYLWLFVVVILIAVVIAMVKLVKNTPGQNVIKVDINSSLTTNEWVEGNKNATTTLVEYGDFQCPACGAFYPVVKMAMKQYGSDVRLIFRHFPLSQHQNALIAAQAAEAAGAQGKFFAMHDMLYENQIEWSEAKNPQDFFVKYAQKIGLDINQFKKDSNSSAALDKIKNQYEDGVSFGVDATPTFFLDNQKLNPPATFQEFLNEIGDAVKHDKTK